MMDNTPEGNDMFEARDTHADDTQALRAAALLLATLLPEDRLARLHAHYDNSAETHIGTRLNIAALNILGSAASALSLPDNLSPAEPLLACDVVRHDIGLRHGFAAIEEQPFEARANHYRAYALSEMHKLDIANRRRVPAEQARLEQALLEATQQIEWLEEQVSLWHRVSVKLSGRANMSLDEEG